MGGVPNGALLLNSGTRQRRTMAPRPQPETVLKGTWDINNSHNYLVDGDWRMDSWGSFDQDSKP